MEPARHRYALGPSLAVLIVGCASTVNPAADGAITDAAPVDAVLLDRTAVDVPLLDAVEPLDGDETPESVPVGSIFAIVTVSQSGLEAGRSNPPRASAIFYRRVAPSVPMDNCPVTTVGACILQRCANPADAGEAPSAFEQVPAGSVYLDGLPMGNTELNWSPGYGYTTGLAGEMIWRGGETLTVRGTGDPAGMPMFSVSVIAPSPIRLSAPFPGRAFGLSATEPLSIRWTGGDPGTVQVVLAAGIQEASGTRPPVSITANCDFPAGAGMGEVPVEVIRSMVGLQSGALIILVTQTRTIRVGTHLVKLLLLHTAASGEAYVQ